MSADGFVCQRCGGLVDVEFKVQTDGRASAEFVCYGCGLRSGSARVPDGKAEQEVPA